MFANCIFCHADLGRNEAVEHFPVGRRIAFDPANGRLWVICRSCARWNLTPLEERWEAIEECERLFRDTRLRVSTDHIGLARIREGTELVRVGEPQRPEMAAWRYGEQFGRRRRNYQLLVGGGVVAVAGVYGGLAMAGVGIAGFNWGWQLLRLGYERANAVRLPAGSGRGTVTVTPSMARRSHLHVDPASGNVQLLVKRGRRKDPVLHGYEGDAAIRNATKLLPKINASGATRRQVEGAIEVLDRAAKYRPGNVASAILQMNWLVFASDRPLKEARRELLLALEMSLHEDAERAALGGELADLEDRWREAEEIASISDNLFLPDSITSAIQSLRSRR